MKRILLVEDEKSIRNLVKLNLELDGYEAVSTGSGQEALVLFKSQHFDLVILDVMLPEINGYDICEQIRLLNSEIPVIFVTAKDQAADRIAGLKRGGDDYLTKPFNLEELLLRIKNLLKRTHALQTDEFDSYVFGDNQVNFKTFEAQGQRGPFMLTKKEALLLKLLIQRTNEVVSRPQILQSVWGYDVYPSTRTIDNFILSFRKYFEPDHSNPIYFLSVRGVGYKFVSSHQS